jgi:phosphoglycerate-specific signal transduction histidine kinase
MFRRRPKPEPKPNKPPHNNTVYQSYKAAYNLMNKNPSINSAFYITNKGNQVKRITRSASGILRTHKNRNGNHMIYGLNQIKNLKFKNNAQKNRALNVAREVTNAANLKKKRLKNLAKERANEHRKLNSENNNYWNRMDPNYRGRY